MSEPTLVIPKEFFQTFRVQEEDDFVFVLMPIKKDYEEVFQEGIRKAVEEDSKLKCVRADSIFSSEPIMTQILTAIEKAHYIIADLSEKNPNVFYELGIAHTRKDRIILITQDSEDVPFDLRHIRYIEYSNTEEGISSLRENLARFLSAFDKEMLKPVQKSEDVEGISFDDYVFEVDDRLLEVGQTHFRHQDPYRQVVSLFLHKAKVFDPIDDLIPKLLMKSKPRVFWGNPEPMEGGFQYNHEHKSESYAYVLEEGFSYFHERIHEDNGVHLGRTLFVLIDFFGFLTEMAEALDYPGKIGVELRFINVKGRELTMSSPRHLSGGFVAERDDICVEEVTCLDQLQKDKDYVIARLFKRHCYSFGLQIDDEVIESFISEIRELP